MLHCPEFYLSVALPIIFLYINVGILLCWFWHVALTVQFVQLHTERLSRRVRLSTTAQTVNRVSKFVTRRNWSAPSAYSGRKDIVGASGRLVWRGYFRDLQDGRARKFIFCNRHKERFNIFETRLLTCWQLYVNIATFSKRRLTNRHTTEKKLKILFQNSSLTNADVR